MWPFRWGKRLSGKHKQQRQEGARTALIVLSCINLLNFADRYVPGSVKGLVKKDLHLTDMQTSLPATGMVIVYMVTSLIVGWLADMRLVDRRKILACGVAFWSLATFLAGFARSFAELFIFRALIGVGEAAYMTIVPPMLADFYPLADRNMVYMVFNLTGPVGGALGFVAGAVCGSIWSWRVAFFVCGVPGLAVSSLILSLNDPFPGANDSSALTAGLDSSREGRRASWVARQSVFVDVRDILAVPHWIVAEIGMVACSFTIGALSDWYDEFLLRSVPGTSVKQAGLVLGAATLLGGVGGVSLGSQVAQALKSRWQNAFFSVPALFMVPSAVMMFLSVNVTVNANLSYLFVLLAEISFFAYMAPVNTAMLNCMPVHLRARSGAMSILLSHVLGDVISPPIVGAISDSTGSLRAGMQLCWIMTVLAGLAWGLGSVFLPPLPGDDNASASKIDGEKAVSHSSLGSVLCGDRGEEEEEEDGAAAPIAGEKIGKGYGAAEGVQGC